MTMTARETGAVPIDPDLLVQWIPIAATGSLQRVSAGSSHAMYLVRRSDRDPPQSDQGWIDHIRTNAVITWHPVGTCGMGPDPHAVVDPELRFRGLRGRRVVDASVMPTTTSSNSNAPTIMIAEKAAEMIRGAARSMSE